MGILNGCLQVPPGTLEKEKVRCYAFRYARPLLGVPPASPGPPCPKAVQTGQGAHHGLQGQAGIRRLACPRGGRKRAVGKGIVYGKPVHQGIRKLKKTRSHRSVAEEKVGRRCSNMRVLNSYWVGQDAVCKFFEVIVVDPAHTAIKDDPRINWIVSEKHNKRELRGLTSAGKKYRGLRQMGYKANALRTSRRGEWRLRNVKKWRRG